MKTRTLSTGDPSTLGGYLKLSRALFGEGSRPVTFLEKKVLESPGGEDEEVITDEGQVMHMLLSLFSKEQTHVEH